MSAPNSDEVEGKIDQAKGKVKETVGDLIGDDEMEAEGKVDHAEGEAQETWGKAKRKVGDAADAVKDVFTGDDDKK
jgi:uncharacterized protein YjbJ (UPF0337 family)